MNDGPTIIQQSSLPAAALLEQLRSSPEGLSAAEAAGRLTSCGPNRIAQQAQSGVLQELYGRLKNPLNGLLLVLAGVSWATGDLRAAILIFAMVVLSVGLAFLQEHRSGKAAEKLRAMVRTRATVLRRGSGWTEAGIEDLVPGDIVKLAAGDLIPADLRILSAKTLHVNQSALTGESLPVDKSDAVPDGATQEPLALSNICFMGSSVISGAATGVVLRTGRNTLFGGIAGRIAANPPQQTSFDRGIAGFTGLMIAFIVAMAPLVFLINGLTKGNWLEAMLFALAVAVGLTPEMLPMIVTVNLAKGALAMAGKRAIVKRLSSIQNFGAMDVLCTDKTGTLTQNKVILQYHLDFEGEESDRVLEYAYLNSYHQSGLRNLMDEAILSHARKPEHVGHIAAFSKVDEIPFDFERRRMSVVLRTPEGGLLMITKGAVEEVLAACTNYRIGEETGTLDPHHLEDAQREMAKLNSEGFRVLAIAFKELASPLPVYDESTETGLTLLGYAAFLDPPKDTARDAIAQLRAAGVAVKILTGDNDLVTRAVCKQVGVDADDILLGRDIAALSPEALGAAAEKCAVFAKLAPEQKSAVIDALRGRGHVVGFLGDGINDGPALKAADVGISVDTAVDIAKESADIILLEKSLTVLCDGAIEGRKVFGNIVKYIKMGASSNFGNMFSVLGASLFLPFLPMLPIQVLTNNLLYDLSQTAIPTDNVDAEYLTAPRRWDLSNLTRFVLTIGPISSIFDYVTFFVMLHVFNAWTEPGLFQAGWFVESIVTQTLIIHIIRTARIPFFESRASNRLILATLATTCIGAIIPYTPLGRTLGFQPLPALYWPILLAMGLGYAVLTHIVKTWFIRRYGV
ncbi:MAG: magnesium-translocating P-type ATPase [Aestuariivirga sp.]|uniref:magnesium-translocating P-type ATPase n=1 Tax=Aestuariivirga sp. TaxID=2650926 RepID=UPI0025BFE2C0|nr:magnesium-translocating P-type ATPase [Aestuariivirga sp.]MCA3560584.1 magnesium-translocating P-type ATPase [Aestuariivirga sp.]